MTHTLSILSNNAAFLLCANARQSQKRSFLICHAGRLLIKCWCVGLIDSTGQARFKRFGLTEADKVEHPSFSSKQRKWEVKGGSRKSARFQALNVEKHITGRTYYKPATLSHERCSAWFTCVDKTCDGQ